MAERTLNPYHLRMTRGRLPVWMAAAFTLVVAGFVLMLWLTHSQRNYIIFIPPALAVAWGWWSAIRGLRERRPKADA